jgi:hypothetical protein
VRIIRAADKQGGGAHNQQQQQQQPHDLLAGVRLRLLQPSGAADEGSSSAAAGAAHSQAPAGSTSSSSGGASSAGGSEGTGSTHSGSDAAPDAGDGGHALDAVDEIQLHGEQQQQGASAVGGAGGWALTLPGLQLDNVGVLEVVQAGLQVMCRRCTSSTALLLTAAGGSCTSTAPAPGTAAAGASTSAAAASGSATTTTANSSSGGSSKARPFEYVGACSVCRADLAVLLRPRFVHASSNVLAGLKATGCSPRDLLPSVYGATCADCDAVCALRGLQVRRGGAAPDTRGSHPVLLGHSACACHQAASQRCATCLPRACDRLVRRRAARAATAIGP